jgi:hypothetical protein
LLCADVLLAAAVQVRADLESAAKLLQKRMLKHADSNNSNTSGSTIFMPPPPAPGQGYAGVLSALGLTTYPTAAP